MDLRHISLSTKMSQAIDRVRRDQLSSLLRSFVAGKITNDEYEDRIDKILDPQSVAKHLDKSIWAIRSASWFLYDDLCTHKLTNKWAIPKDGKREISKWILFLRSDYTYKWKTYRFIGFGTFFLNLLTFGLWNKLQLGRKEKIDPEIWPFYTQEELNSMVHPNKPKVDRDRTAHY